MSEREGGALAVSMLIFAVVLLAATWFVANSRNAVSARVRATLGVEVSPPESELDAAERKILITDLSDYFEVKESEHD